MEGLGLSEVVWRDGVEGGGKGGRGEAKGGGQKESEVKVSDGEKQTGFRHLFTPFLLLEYIT